MTGDMIAAELVSALGRLIGRCIMCLTVAGQMHGLYRGVDRRWKVIGKRGKGSHGGPQSASLV